MQVRKFKKTKDFFGHGSIFRINKLKLINSNNQQLQFKQFYPEADVSGIEYAVICTQDCDIDQKKVTHVNIALLEPIQRAKKENPIRFLDLKFSSLITQFNDMNFYSPSILNQVKNKVEELLDNTNSHYMFVSIDSKHYFINLTKLFPLKFSHLDNLKKEVEYQLDGSFKHLLGWKIANMYGRVGVDIYEKTKRDSLTIEILTSVLSSIKSSFPENSFQLTESQLNELKSDLGTYNGLMAKNKNADKLKEKINEKLVEYGILKKEPIR